MAAMNQLAERRNFLSAEVNAAYNKGYQMGETAEVQESEHHPALLRATGNIKAMMLARMRAQQQEKSTLDARNKLREERKVAMALTAEENSEPRAYKAWESMGGSGQEKFAAQRMSLAMAEANKDEPAAYKKMQQAMKAEEASEPRAYKAWESMGGSGQEKFAAHRMQLAMAEANKDEPAAYKKMQEAMKAEEASEPRAYRAWEGMGGSGQEKFAAQRMSLAMAEANKKEPAAYSRMQEAIKAEEASEPAAYKKMQQAVKAEEHMEPRAYEAWKSMGGQKLSAAKRVSLAEAAEERMEPAAWRHAELEGSRASRMSRAMAEERLEKMNREISKGIRKSELQEKAIGEATELLQFCNKEFGGNSALRQFCFEKLSSPPQREQEMREMQQPEQFTGRNLRDAIERAHAAGVEGMPKYAVYHTPVGDETFKLVRVPPGGRTPSDAVGFVDMPDVNNQASTRLSQMVSSARESNGPVKIDAPTLKAAIEKAHAEGLRGEPKYVVFHPANGEPEVFKLM